MSGEWQTTEELNAQTHDLIDYCIRTLAPDEWRAALPSLISLAMTSEWQRPHTDTPSDLRLDPQQRTNPEAAS